MNVRGNEQKIELPPKLINMSSSATELMTGCSWNAFSKLLG